MFTSEREVVQIKTLTYKLLCAELQMFSSPQNSLTRRQKISPVVPSEQAFHSSQSFRPHSCLFPTLSPWITTPYQFISNPNPRQPPRPPRQMCMWTLPVYYHVSRQRLSVLGICHEPVEPPGDTSTSPIWHSALTRLSKTWQPSTYGEGWNLRVQRCERSWDLPDKKSTLVKGWSIGADLSPSGDLLGLSHPFLSRAPVMTASLQIFADTNQN